MKIYAELSLNRVGVINLEVDSLSTGEPSEEVVKQIIRAIIGLMEGLKELNK